MAYRSCATPGCPELYPKAEGTRCAKHRTEKDQARGTRQQRGYTSEHDRLRAEWKPRVSTGRIRCPKCSEPIKPSAPWDLGHSDDRLTWTGPEHRRCNRSEAGRKSHRTLPASPSAPF